MRKLLTVFLCVVAGVVYSQKKAKANEPTLKWKCKVGAIFGSPVIDDAAVFIASADSTVRALSILDGKEKWNFKTYGAIRSTPVISNDHLVTVSEDGAVYAVNVSTGELVWRFISPQGTLGERKYDRADYFQSSPIVHDNKVFVGLGDYLYVLSDLNGQLLWSFKTGNLVHTRPAIAGDKVIFGSYDGNIYALYTVTGALVWKFKTVGQRFFPNGEVMGNPVVSKEVVYIGSRDYNFYALDVNSGYCYWNKVFPKGWALAASIMKDSVLYLGTSDDYVMISMNPRNGAEFWRTSLKYNVFGSMAFSGDHGYVGTLMGKLFQINLKTGAIEWTYRGEGYIKNGK